MTAPKPYIPSYRILIENREQAAFRFTGLTQRESKGGGPILVETACGHMETGDYSLDGMQHRVAIERKSRDDLYGTLGKGRDRFKAELERLSTMEFAAVVVECDWVMLLTAPPGRSRVPPQAIEGSVLAMQQDFPRVQWQLATDRRHAEWMTWFLLDRFWRKQRGTEANPIPGGFGSIGSTARAEDKV